MRIAAGALVASLLLATPAGAGPARPAAPLDPRGSILEAAHYRIDLGEPDDPRAPRAWQGPLRISGPAGRSCTVNPDVAILQRPFSLSRGHLLAVSTFSGSEARVYVVDLRDCAIRAESPSFSGAARFVADKVRLPGLGDFAIDPAGRLLHASPRRR